MERIGEIRKARRAEGQACILGIGSACPSNIMYQKDYPDYYFRVTKSEDKVQLKEKFKLICENIKIKKRHIYLTEEHLKANPNMVTFGAPSLDARYNLTIDYVPKLACEAALKAIQDWGQPKSKITHFLFCTTLGLSQPGLDQELVTTLGLDVSSVQRTAFHSLGCHAGPCVLRHAMGMAESNKDARILVIYAELTTMNFHGPHEDYMASLISQASLGDGAAAVIVGADPVTSIEKSLFVLAHGEQTTVIYGSTSSIFKVAEMGQILGNIPKELPDYVSNNLTCWLDKALESIGGVCDLNSLFWIPHGGGHKILDYVEAKLGLDKEKFEVARHIISEYGQIEGVGSIFMLDEMRKRSIKEQKSTTGFGNDWGVMFGCGPAMTIEMLVLHSMPI
ncbi:Chalcone synthase 2 [Bienertia sinuspersici]